MHHHPTNIIRIVLSDNKEFSIKKSTLIDKLNRLTSKHKREAQNENVGFKLHKT